MSRSGLSPVDSVGVTCPLHPVPLLLCLSPRPQERGSGLSPVCLQLRVGWPIQDRGGA